MPFGSLSLSQSRKEVCIGRALGYTVALKISYDQESMDAHCHMMDGLLELDAQTELRELCAVNSAEMLSRQSTQQISHVFRNCPGLVKRFEKSPLDATTEVSSIHFAVKRVACLL